MKAYTRTKVQAIAQLGPDYLVGFHKQNNAPYDILYINLYHYSTSNTLRLLFFPSWP